MYVQGSTTLLARHPHDLEPVRPENPLSRVVHTSKEPRLDAPGEEGNPQWCFPGIALICCRNVPGVGRSGCVPGRDSHRQGSGSRRSGREQAQASARREHGEPEAHGMERPEPWSQLRPEPRQPQAARHPREAHAPAQPDASPEHGQESPDRHPGLPRPVGYLPRTLQQEAVLHTRGADRLARPAPQAPVDVCLERVRRGGKPPLHHGAHEMKRRKEAQPDYQLRTVLHASNVLEDGLGVLPLHAPERGGVRSLGHNALDLLGRRPRLQNPNCHQGRAAPIPPLSLPGHQQLDGCKRNRGPGDGTGQSRR